MSDITVKSVIPDTIPSWTLLFPAAGWVATAGLLHRKGCNLSDSDKRWVDIGLAIAVIFLAFTLLAVLQRGKPFLKML